MPKLFGKTFAEAEFHWFIVLCAKNWIYVVSWEFISVCSLVQYQKALNNFVNIKEQEKYKAIKDIPENMHFIHPVIPNMSKAPEKQLTSTVILTRISKFWGQDSEQLQRAWVKANSDLSEWHEIPNILQQVHCCYFQGVSGQPIDKRIWKEAEWQYIIFISRVSAWAALLDQKLWFQRLHTSYLATSPTEPPTRLQTI